MTVGVSTLFAIAAAWFFFRHGDQNRAVIFWLATLATIAGTFWIGAFLAYDKEPSKRWWMVVSPFGAVEVFAGLGGVCWSVNSPSWIIDTIGAAMAVSWFAGTMGRRRAKRGLRYQ